MAMFTFQDICQSAYGAADFIALSKVFHIICLTQVPQMSVKGRDEVRKRVTHYLSSLYALLFYFMSTSHFNSSLCCNECLAD